MQISAFSSLVKNLGDELTNAKVYKVEVDRETFKDSHLYKLLPQDVATIISGGYAWICWTIEKQNPLTSLQSALEEEDAFSGEVSVESLNLLSDSFWKPIGYRMIKKAFYNEAYRRGGFFLDEKNRLCHPRKICERQGKQLLSALDLRVYRNTDRNNFYLSFDVKSKPEESEGCPLPTEMAREIFSSELTPNSQKRISRLKEFLKPIKGNDGYIKFYLNNKEIKFKKFLRLPTEVKTFGLP